MSTAPRPCGFAAELRLRRSSDYEQVYAGRQRFSDARLLIYAARNNLPHSRIGFSVSRKHGNSVKRHRLKRLLREAWRLIRVDLPAGLDLVVIPQTGTAPGMVEYQGSLERLVRKAARRLLADAPAPDSAH